MNYQLSHVSSITFQFDSNLVFNGDLNVEKFMIPFQFAIFMNLTTKTRATTADKEGKVQETSDQKNLWWNIGPCLAQIRRGGSEGCMLVK